MYDFLYYLTLPFVLASASITSCYIFYPNETKKQFLNISWNITKFFVECDDIIKKMNNTVHSVKYDFLDKNSETDSDYTENDDYEEVIVYNHNLKDSFTFSRYDFKEETNINNNENINLILYHVIENGNEYYKRLDKMSHINTLKNDNLNLEVKTIEKQFIQVEYIYEDSHGNEKIIDIHSNLGDFYVKGNIILDRYFLEWYLKSFYNIEIASEYKLRFFDKDVNMFTLSMNNAILLCDEKYSKIDIDDNTFLIRDEVYEGAEEEEKSR